MPSSYITSTKRASTSARTVSLEPHADAGNPTAARVSPNGNGVVVIGGRDVFVFDETRPLEKVRPLARGYTVRAGDIVERIHDAAVDDDGNLLVVADVVFAETPDKRPRAALLAWDPKRPMTYTVVRKAGDAVVDAPEGSVADRFRLQSVGSDGSVTVVEAFLEGGVGQAKDTSSQAFVQNPERLLVGHLDRMSSLREIARTDDAAGGLPRRALHAFLDGVSLPDGRVFFDANFKEEGRAGWLFVSARDAVTAVARPRYPDGAPWAPRAPRLRDLGVDFDGNALFIDGKLGRRLAFGPIENLENTRVFDLSSLRPPSSRAAVVAVHRALLSTRGQHALLEVELMDGGKSKRALLSLALTDDNAKPTLVIGEGDALPRDGVAGAQSDGPVITSLRLAPRAPDPLWLLDE